MKLSWKWKSQQAPEFKEGVATYCFAGGDMEVPLTSFKMGFELAQAISKEMEAAAEAERKKLAHSLYNHIESITR